MFQEYLLTFFSLSRISLMGQCAAVIHRFCKILVAINTKKRDSERGNRIRKKYLNRIPSDHCLNTHLSGLLVPPDLHHLPNLLLLVLH
jgi:hypothetical protein